MNSEGTCGPGSQARNLGALQAPAPDIAAIPDRTPGCGTAPICVKLLPVQ